MAATGLPAPKSDAELRTQAETDVNASLAGQTAPLITEQGTLASRETNAIGQIGSMFDSLQPVVQGEADSVQSSYDTANESSRMIFEAAQNRLGQLRQSRAQEAQTLAQQMGGPVAVSEFTAAVDPDQQALANIAPNQLLHGLANAQAGTQQARAFSERVFPAMRTEQVANARDTYEKQIEDLRKQIDQINSQRGSLVNSRLSDLQKSEREYALQQAQLALDKLKADRDWQATQRTLHNDDVRLGLSKKSFGLQEAGVTGKYKGKPTIQSVKLSVEERQAAARLGLSVAAYKERQRHNLVSEGTAATRANNQAKANAMKIVDAVTGRNKSGMTMTRRRELDPLQGAIMVGKGNSKVQKVVDKKGHTHYYISETVHLTPQQVERTYGSGFASDPQQLYDMLIGSNIPKAMALQVVKNRTLVHDFQPGKTVKYTSADLHAIGKKSFNELRGIALARGMKPDPKHPKNTQQMIDFILGTQSGMP